MNNCNILIIEDDEIDALAFKKHIEDKKLQYSCHLAKSLSQAKDLLNNRHFDIILADFDLPDGNFFELKEISKEIPTIIITGHGSEEIAEKAFKYDVSDYLIKDHSRNYLNNLIKRIEFLILKKATEFQLHERLKEISALYNIQKLLSNRRRPNHELFPEIIGNIITAFQFPEKTCCEIRLDDLHFYSDKYTPPHPESKTLSENIYIKTHLRGYVIVHNHTPDINFSFLLEEKDFIASIANEIGKYLERVETRNELQVMATSFESWDSIIITDAERRILKINAACIEIFGFSENELLNKSLEVFYKSNHRLYDRYLNQVFNISEKAGFWQGEMTLTDKSGIASPFLSTISAIRSDSNPNQINNFVIILRDLSSQKLVENQIYNLHFFDQLTGLPNNNQVETFLTKQIKWKQIQGLLFVDIDNFRRVNDITGRQNGDKLLKQFSDRMKEFFSSTEDNFLISRVESDKFVVIIKNNNIEFSELFTMAEQLRFSINEPFSIEDKEHYLTSTIGVVPISPELTLDTIRKKCNMTIEKGKIKGGNGIFFLDDLEHKQIEELSQLEFELHQMTYDEELHLYYQIQVDINQNIIGAEALLRWHHPTHGVLPPAKFMSLIEKNSIALEIGQWVLNKACAQLAIWSGCAKTKQLVLAVNIGSKQFHDEDFVENVRKTVTKYKIDPSTLKLELTESILMDSENALHTIKALREIGVELALDDFGTGYSSLSYLKKLDVQQLKIDRSFITEIPYDDDSKIMVKAIIDMAKNFKLNVLAEGIETEAQLTFLKEQDCDLFQGYLFAKPMQINEIEYFSTQQLT